MPGLVDFVVPVAKIPEILIDYGARMGEAGPHHAITEGEETSTWLAAT